MRTIPFEGFEIYGRAVKRNAIFIEASLESTLAISPIPQAIPQVYAFCTRVRACVCTYA